MDIFAIILCVVLIIGTGVFLFFSNKTGLVIISAAKGIVEFIKNALKETNFLGETANDILDFILQTLAYVQGISGLGASTDEKIEKATTYFKELCDTTGITLTEDEFKIIKTIIKTGFMFMDALNISTRVNATNYTNLYKNMTVSLVGNFKPVGLRAQLVAKNKK